MRRAWKRSWFDTGVRLRGGTLWRGVEAQHVVATLRLVDSLDEQGVLEDLLESSKPPVPPGAERQHYLIFTPFRYRSPTASRFRRAIDPGVWYGAEELRTAAGEVGYWKWRFLTDSDGLAGQALHTEHTFFATGVRGRCADLTRPPWDAASRVWRRAADYAACQDLADEARTRAVAWFRYASVRVSGGVCGAVLEPASLSLPEAFERQTWVCKTSRTGAYLQRAGGGERFEFSASTWDQA